MDTTSVRANDVIAFFVELAALAMLCAWGFQTGGTATRWLLGLGLPAVAIALWGLFAAPRARYDRPALRLLVIVLVLGGGAAAAFGVLPLAWAVAFAVVVVANTTLSYVGPFAGERRRS